MKVFVIGAHGKIGTLLLPKLIAAGHQVFAGIRKEDQGTEIKAVGATPVLIDLLGDTQGIADHLADMDAVVFAAGSGGATGDDMTMLVDLDGAAKSVEAATMVDVHRFVIISSGASDRRENWGQAIRPYMAAKYYADLHLRESGLAYTIVRPGYLTNEKATNRFSTAPFTTGINQNTSITREDVAQFIATAISTPSTIGQEYDVVNGSETLAEIFN